MPFTFWDDPAATRLLMTEHRLHDLISSQISERMKEFPAAAVGDSFAIRAYLPCRRDFNDIDIVFPHSVPPQVIMELARRCSGDPEIIIGEASGRFVRIKYIVPHLDKLGSDFRIDFHIGGIWYKETAYSVDAEFFRGSTWRQVPFGGEGMTVLLPIPRLESLFVLKVVKFIGADVVDVLLILAYETIDIEYILSRLSERNETDIAAKNLRYISNNLSLVLSNWSHLYLADMAPETLGLVKQRLGLLTKKVL